MKAQIKIEQDLLDSQIISNDNNSKERNFTVEESFRFCFKNAPDYTCSEIIEPMICDLEEEGIDCSEIWKMYNEKLLTTIIVSKEEAQRMCDDSTKVTKTIRRI